MIVLDIPQGSPEWHAARLGIPTASRFGDILTSQKKSSSSAGRYMDELLAEWMAGKPVDTVENTVWMDRGHELEQEARLRYELDTELAVAQVGFVYLDEGRAVGASPDGLVKGGGLEIKCPKASTLVSYYGKGCPAKYIPQVQGCMWICDRPWWDFFGYHPDLPPHLVRVERDEGYIRLLAEAVEEFNSTMYQRREELKEWATQ